MLATVSLAVAVSDSQDGTILGMPTADVSALPQGSPEPISAGKVWALWTDRCSWGGGGGRACHLHFNIFQGVMSKKKRGRSSGLIARAHDVLLLC